MILIIADIRGVGQRDKKRREEQTSEMSMVETWGT
jgi:hypothetical protein